MSRRNPVRRLLVVAAAAVLIPAPVAFAADITGTDRSDTLTGTAGADRIDALGGNDTVAGGAGGDTVFGGFGADDITGGPGRDDLRGGPGADLVDGGQGSDRILGVGADLAHAGDDGDLLYARRGSSVLHGDAGGDVLSSALTSGQPELHGDEGDDSLSAQELRDEPPFGHADLFGGRGDDFLRSKDDGKVRAGPGDDLVFAGRASIVDGGDGNDRLVTETEPALATPLRCGEGLDVVEGDVADVFPADCEEVTVLVHGPLGGGAHVTGTSYDDRVDVRDGGNTVETFEGDDFVELGSLGVGDEVSLGPGDDFVYSNNDARFPRSDQISCGPGHDQVRAGAGDVIADDCEDVTVFFYGFDEADDITGTAYPDHVDTNGGDDTVRTRGSDDVIYPGDGADTVDAGAGDDVVIPYGDGSVDRITCGPGADRVEGGDPRDVYATDCEVVPAR